MKQEKHYKILDETDELVLGYIFEKSYLTIKKTNENVCLGDFYGNPKCGVISKRNDWCVVGGQTIVIWTKDKIIRIDDDELNWIFDIRQISEDKIELLIDPWTDKSAIWEFDVITKEKNKIKNFTDYKDEEYSETVVW